MLLKNVHLTIGAMGSRAARRNHDMFEAMQIILVTLLLSCCLTGC